MGAGAAGRFAAADRRTAADLRHQSEPQGTSGPKGVPGEGRFHVEPGQAAYAGAGGAVLASEASSHSQPACLVMNRRHRTRHPELETASRELTQIRDIERHLDDR
jgi:hypothetical protein